MVVLRFILYIFSDKSENFDMHFLYILFIYYNIVISCIICSLATFVNRTSFFFLPIPPEFLSSSQKQNYIFHLQLLPVRILKEVKKNKRTTRLNDTLILIHLFLNVNTNLFAYSRKDFLLAFKSCLRSGKACNWYTERRTGYIV